MDPRNGGDVEAVRNLLATLAVTVFMIATPGDGVPSTSPVTAAASPPSTAVRVTPRKLLGFPGVDIQSHGNISRHPTAQVPGPRLHHRVRQARSLADGGDPDGAENFVEWVAAVRNTKPRSSPRRRRGDGTPPDPRPLAYLNAVIRNQAAQISAMEPDSGRNQALYRPA